jgi:hypothetical protein
MLVGPAAYVERHLCTCVYVCLQNKNMLAPTVLASWGGSSAVYAQICGGIGYSIVHCNVR